MGMKEIVAAVVDSVIITDASTIDALAALGKHVRYVSRREVQRLAVDAPNSWGNLAAARALYVQFEGCLLRSA